MRIESRHHLFQATRQEQVINAQVLDVFTAGVLKTFVEVPCQPDVLFVSEETYPPGLRGEFRDQGFRLVRGAVVNDYDFKVLVFLPEN
jgi:hypothetical protein